MIDSLFNHLFHTHFFHFSRQKGNNFLSHPQILVYYLNFANIFKDLGRACLKIVGKRKFGVRFWPKARPRSLTDAGRNSEEALVSLSLFSLSAISVSVVVMNVH